MSIGPRAPFDPEGFRSIRGAHTLERESLSILRELYLLRDKLAARADKPPFKVFGNHQLIEIATTAPHDFDALRRATGFPEHLVRRFGSASSTPSTPASGTRPASRSGSARRTRDRPDDQLAWVEILKAWRREASARDHRTTMAILPNHLLHRLAEIRPTTLAQLARDPATSASAASNATASRSSTSSSAATSPPGPSLRRRRPDRRLQVHPTPRFARVGTPVPAR